jgi:hypothetical protein
MEHAHLTGHRDSAHCNGMRSGADDQQKEWLECEVWDRWDEEIAIATKRVDRLTR